MPLEPPPFQEAPRCDVCKCSFNTFRRRHHCRRCGRTLCHEHSSNQMALPQFGIHTNVRVCAECFNDSTRSEKVDPQVTSDGISSVTDKVSRLDIDADTDSKTESATQQDSSKIVIECKCGMPLCICEAPAPAPAPTVDTRPLQMKAPTASTSQSNARAKKVDGAPKNRGSTSNSKPSRLTNELFQAEFLERAKICSSVFNYGQTNAAVDKPQMDYEASGEGLREAIKNGDTAAVKKLLSEGVDANYHDKQGLSLLHLAALFNRTDIAFTLMDSGASLDYKNAQGETPLDCAPATLQYKMRNKMGVSAEQGPSTSI